MVEVIKFGKIYLEDLAIGNGTATVTLADGSTVALTEIDLANATAASYAYASLPAAATATRGRLYNVTDNIGGLWRDTGSQVIPVGGTVINLAEYPFNLSPSNSAATNNAGLTAGLAALPSTGGTLFLPTGVYQFSSAINLTNKLNVRLCGTGAGNYSGTGTGSELLWTGGVGTGAAIKAPGAIGLEIDHLSLTYSAAGYNGNLLSLNSTGGSLQTSNVHIHHMRLGGNASALSAARLIELNATLHATIGPKVFFDYATVGIGCSGSGNNSIHVIRSYFNPDVLTQIKGWGTAWNIIGNLFESPTGTGAVRTAFGLDGWVGALRFCGNHALDGGTGDGTLVDLSNVAGTYGALIEGNSLSGGSGTAVKLDVNWGTRIGLNTMSGLALGVDLGQSIGSSVEENVFQNLTTAWNGSGPTRFTVRNNKYDNVTNRGGIAVSNGYIIGLTPSGTGKNDGLCLLMVQVLENPVPLLIALTGTAGTVVPVGTTDLGYASYYSYVKGVTDSLTHVYYDAGNNRWELENKTGGTIHVNAQTLTGF